MARTGDTPLRRRLLRFALLYLAGLSVAGAGMWLLRLLMPG